MQAVTGGLLALLVLTGCSWTDTVPVPVVPQSPVPQPEVPESSAPRPEAPESPPPERSAPSPHESTVVYSVEGTGTASVTYVAVQGGSVVQQSTSGTPLPFTKTMTVSGRDSAVAAVLTLIAVGTAETDTLSCTITRDGEVVAEQASTGPFAAVTCNATNN